MITKDYFPEKKSQLICNLWHKQIWKLKRFYKKNFILESRQFSNFGTWLP